MVGERKKNELVCGPMSVADLAEKIDRPVNAIIIMLLKQGISANRNQFLTADIVARVAEFFDIPVIKPVAKTSDAKSFTECDDAAPKGTIAFDRMPVVVVVGHVDHGKTTLLDYIRKTRVAAREKGGITQHVGAYEAKTSHGNIVFIDTPGHEAFSVMRSRGLSIADIAILVVGVDNGVQPQTIEAYELAKKAGVPIIVALNKIDKASPKQIEEVRHALSRIGLVPEEWGGEVVFVPVSALKGDGVDTLLDMIMLQAQMKGLSTFLDVPALGFVLESRLEKGRGPVATVIARSGVLRVGNYFVCGETSGRISSLKDWSGESIIEAKPSVPVVVAGFSELPRSGDLFTVCAVHEIKKMHTAMVDERRLTMPVLQGAQAGSVRILIKTDTATGKEVLVSAIEKLSPKTHSGVSILYSGVGPVNESDVTYAADTQAAIYTLHVKADVNALRVAQEMSVAINHFDIIYKLLESLEEVAQRGRPVKKVIKKVGEAIILKVFDIKKLGVIAGARVTEGVCNRNSTVKVIRGARVIGKGSISSLQRDRNPAKEVRKGFECAFVVDGFTEWQVDDRVECYNEVRED